MPGRGREDKPEKPERAEKAEGSQGHSLVKQVTRIADALERAYPPPPPVEEPPPTES